MSVVSRTLWIAALTLLLSTAASAEPQEFPGRKLYPEVPIIERNELHGRMDQVYIVDVRSLYEFETLRIKGAYLIPVSSDDFSEQVSQLRQKYGDKPIIFYCNGHSCEKSYQAVRKASAARLGKVYAYDAGIFDWARNYPEQTELLGQKLDINALISDDKFKAHLLEPGTFTEQASNSNGIILDIRDRFQREGFSLFSGKEKSVPLDNTKLKSYVDMAKHDNKTLYVYDATGHQVKWLQYFLEANGLENYYFMKDGASGFYDLLRKDAGLRAR